MIEQEKRENAIEEMAQFMCETGEKSCAECKGEPDVECAMWNEAVRLYDAGYRKADEVRKETSQKFLQLWYDDMFNAGECVGHIEKLAKEMGSKDRCIWRRGKRMIRPDRRIEEMAGIAFSNCEADYRDILALRRLVDAGYRKEEEVQKETAKKILTDLVKLARWEDGLNTVSIRQIKEKAKEFGVEVEE